MKSNNKLVIMVLMFVALIGGAFASPLVVSDVKVYDDENLASVSITNAAPANDGFGEVYLEIEELGISENVETVNVENGTETFTYNLRDLSAYDSLKRGDIYTLVVSVRDVVAGTTSAEVSESFLIGSASSALESDALGLVLEEIEIDDIEVTDIDSLQVLNGDVIEVQMKFTATESFDDARITVSLDGYEHAPIYESTPIFQAIEGKTYVKKLNLNLPSDIDSQKDYTLRIIGANDLSGITYKEFTLYVDTDRHRVDIVDLVMTPSSGVEPGQNIIANVRMKNRGQKSQDSTKVTVSIPELGISESSYISNLNPSEVATSDDMLLFIPDNAAAGSYDVVTTLAYDDGYTSTTDSFALNILSPNVVAEENLLVSFRNNIDLSSGEARTFEVVIANPNAESKPISIGALDNAWAETTISPTLAFIKGDSSETFTVTVTPKAGAAGEKELRLVVKERENAVSEFTVSTFVEAGDEINWLNVVLVVLLIIAIIILLALVITIAKRKGDDDEGDEISSTEEYY